MASPTAPTPGQTGTPANGKLRENVVVVTTRVLQAIARGDIDARRVLLHLNTAARASLLLLPGPLADLLAPASSTFKFVAPARVRDELKAFLNDLITKHQISYDYAAHLYYILLSPITLGPPQTGAEFADQAKERAGDTPDADYVALRLATDAHGVWEVDTPPATWPAGADFLVSTRELSILAGVPVTARVFQVTQAPQTVEIPPSVLEPAGEAAQPVVEAPLPALPEPSLFEPKAVEWALRYFGLKAGPDFRVPVFLEDLPPLAGVEDIATIDFSASKSNPPTPEGGYLTVEILHALRVPDHYKYIFIEKERDPYVGEFWEDSSNWNVNDTDEKAGDRTVSRAREHLLYWGTTKPWGGEKPPDLFPAVDVAAIAGTSGNTPDATRDIFIASDHLDRALDARQKAVTDFIQHFHVSLTEFEQVMGFPVDMHRLGVYAGVLHLRFNSAQPPTSETGKFSSKPVANFAAGPFNAFIRDIDTTVYLRKDIKKIEQSRGYSPAMKGKDIKRLLEEMEKIKNQKYEGLL